MKLLLLQTSRHLLSPCKWKQAMQLLPCRTEGMTARERNGARPTSLLEAEGVLCPKRPQCHQPLQCPLQCP